MFLLFLIEESQDRINNVWTTNFYLKGKLKKPKMGGRVSVHASDSLNKKRIKVESKDSSEGQSGSYFFMLIYCYKNRVVLRNKFTNGEFV